MDTSTWHQDADGDGFGDPGVDTQACAAPEGWVENSADCDDGCADCWTGHEEVCNDGVDNDCDGTANDCELFGERTPEDLDFAVLPFANTLSYWPGLATADLDGDGAHDLLVTASDELTETAGMWIFLGAQHGDVPLGFADAHWPTPYSQNCHWLVPRGAGDLDGDGWTDLVLADACDSSAAQSAGALHLAMGPVTGGGHAIEAASSWFGTTENEVAGWGLASAGDVDGDGLPDLLVGAALLDGEQDAVGGAYLLLDAAVEGEHSLGDADLTILGDVPWGYLGYAVAGPGDLDGDGLAELAVGALEGSSGGDVYIYSGASASHMGVR